MQGSLHIKMYFADSYLHLLKLIVCGPHAYGFLIQEYTEFQHLRQGRAEIPKNVYVYIVMLNIHMGV